MKIYRSILFCLSLIIPSFVQSEIFDTVKKEIGNLKKGIVPSLSPVVGAILPPVGYFTASLCSKKNSSINSIKHGCFAGSSIIGMGLGYWLYNRTSNGVKNQAKNLLKELENEDKLFGIKKKYITGQVNDIDYDAIIDEFSVDIPHSYKLSNKVEYLKRANDYFYQVSQKIKWLTPKLKKLQQNGDQESSTLSSKLDWYPSFIKNLRNKCVDYVDRFEQQIALSKNSQIDMNQKQTNINAQQNKIEQTKDKSRRENIKVLREVRKVIYDWRYLISSGLVLVFGSKWGRAFCMRYPEIAAILGIGAAGTLFLPPYSANEQ